MSLPSKERFYHVGISIPIERDESGKYQGKFNHKYSYLESGRTFTKDIQLTILGSSNNRDLITNDETAQLIATDQNGEIYEIAVSQGYVIAIRDIRTTKK